MTFPQPHTHRILLLSLDRDISQQGDLALGIKQRFNSTWAERDLVKAALGVLCYAAQQSGQCPLQHVAGCCKEDRDLTPLSDLDPHLYRGFQYAAQWLSHHGFYVRILDTLLVVLDWNSAVGPPGCAFIVKACCPIH